ncbi:MAG: hypothetical protein ACI83D_000297 [Planctomycetota bacterium]|jgi:hypothetical protein
MGAVQPITLDKLEDQIEAELEKHTIILQFKEWALEILNRKNDQEVQNRTKIYEQQHKSLVQTQKAYPELKAEYNRLELDKTLTNKRKSKAFASLILNLGGHRESFSPDVFELYSSASLRPCNILTHLLQSRGLLTIRFAVKSSVRFPVSLQMTATRTLSRIGLVIWAAKGNWLEPKS